MMKPMEPAEETQVIRKQVGFSWSFSYEYGATGNRQKLFIAGNTESVARAMAELKEAKIRVMDLAAATVEGLTQPRNHDLDKMYNERDETGNVSIDRE